MKKGLLIIAGLILSLGLIAQQVDREKVVLEIGTATWCTYCPGAAMGAEDLIANGHDVAVIEYHTSDSYTNTEATTRANYYGISGIPDAWFDGILNVGGGSHTQSMYSSYLPKYQQRIAIPSSFTIDMDVSSSGLDYTVDVTIEKVDEYTGTNLVFQLALTESHIEESWQGMDELMWVERLMAPSANGTALDFSGGNVVNFQLNFTIGADWNIEFCERAGFVQDNTSKEILQGGLKILATPEFDVDAEVMEVYDMPEEVCSGNMAPKVTIRNRGAEALTSLDVQYTVNGSDPVTYTWNGDLDFLDKDSFELPEISYEVQETNTVEVTILNPNGTNDENPDNNVTTGEVMEAETINPVSYLILRTDENPDQTTWNLKNSSGEILYEGGPYTDPVTFHRDTFNLYNTECYTLTVFDAGGDGLCCGNGTGFVRLVNDQGGTIVYGMEFGDEYVGEFNVFAPVGISDISGKLNVEVYPNPLNDRANIVLNLTEEAEVTIEAYDMMGKKVLSLNEGIMPAGASNITLDATDFATGIYVLHINAGDAVITHKITIE
jgi:hypothetical protein